MQNVRLKCQKSKFSKYRAKWKVNMPKCSKYHAKRQTLSKKTIVKLFFTQLDTTHMESENSSTNRGFYIRSCQKIVYPFYIRSCSSFRQPPSCSGVGDHLTTKAQFAKNQWICHDVSRKCGIPSKGHVLQGKAR